MSGFLDNCRWPRCECVDLGEKRNLIVSVISGVMDQFSVKWTNPGRGLYHWLYGTNRCSNLAVHRFPVGVWSFDCCQLDSLWLLYCDVDPDWPGIAVFLQNALIFFSAFVFKFEWTEDLWG